MPLKQALKILLILSVLSFIPTLLSGCTTAQIPDTPWEAALGKGNGAVVFTTLSSNTVRRTDAQFLDDWYDITNKQGVMMCTRSSFFAQLKAFQESECSTGGNCSNMTPMQSKQFLQFMSNLQTATQMQKKLQKK